MKTHYNITFLLCLILSFCNAQSEKDLIKQTDSIYKIYKKTPVEGITALNNLLALQDTLKPTEEIANVYHRIGLLYENKKNKKYNKAINSYRKAIKIRQAISPINQKKINNSLYNISNCYKALKEKDKRRSTLEQIVKSNSLCKFFCRAHIRLAYMSKNEGDYYTALKYLNKLILSYDMHKNIKMLYDAHGTSIYVYSLKENTPNDLVKIENHKNQIEQLLNAHPNLKFKLDVYNNLGKIYKDLTLYDKALDIYEYALLKCKQENNAIKLALIYNNLGELYSITKQNDKAKLYYKLAIDNAKENPYILSGVYANQGDNLNTPKAIDKIPYFEKAIQTLFNTKQDTSVFKLPTLKQLENSPYKPYALIYLSALANNLVNTYEEDKKTIHLKRAKTILYKVDQLVSLMRYDSSSDQSKLFWINEGVDSYMLAVKVSHLLNEPETAFYFMEKNKSLLLLENLNVAQEKERLQIPDSILQHEFNLRYAILDLEDKLQKTPNDKALTNLYLQKEGNYTQFLDTLKTNYPNYFNTKKEPTILSLNDAKAKHISQNTSYVEYILNDTNGYGLYCDNKGTKLFKIQDIPTLLQQLDTLKTLVSTPIIEKKKYEVYKTTAFSVFSKLFPFENALLRISNKKLTVIPDYKLRTLPFEALITSQNDNDILPNYLIQHTEVSYYQSTSVFKQIEQKQRAAKNELVGFAPITFTSDSLSNLLGSKKEMDAISNIVTSKLLTNTQATKAAFLSEIKDYGVIHINTHAGLGKNNEPWIAFTDDKLSLKELYGINNQANLVVLDACKSATGTIEQGEGVMSLSRGFFYSGAESVIASQWNVNEQSNNKILIAFYKNLKEGQTKSKALHNAKLEYLNTHQVGELSPYFWSSLMLTGNPNAIKIDTPNSFILKAIVIALVILLLLFIARKILASR